MIPRPILVLDFDGVICDSTEECVVTAWNAWTLRAGEHGHVRTPVEVPEPFRTTLRQYRSYVRTAGEYLILIEAARTGRRIDSQADYDRLFEEFNAELSDFARLFFSARDELRTEDETHWLDLHSVYEGIPGNLRTLCAAFDFYVVTGKDARSVQTFFDRFGLRVPPSHVYDKDVAHDKLSAICMIAANAGQPLNSAYFLDDNVYHLLPAHQAGCHAYMASWGYHTPEQLQVAQEESIPILELGNWVEALMQSGVKA